MDGCLLEIALCLVRGGFHETFLPWSFRRLEAVKLIESGLTQSYSWEFPSLP